MRRLDPRRIVLLLALLGAPACGVGQALVPGDVRRFDPVAALPRVVEFAGSSVILVGFGANAVREDGTVDLKADYIEDDDGANYDFVRPRATGAPLGAGSRYTRLRVWVRRPGLVHGTSGMSYRTGMELMELSPTDDSPKATAPPVCSLARVWSAAREHGAPAGAVAGIRYDDTGYTLYINRDDRTFEVNADCTFRRVTSARGK